MTTINSPAQNMPAHVRYLPLFQFLIAGVGAFLSLLPLLYFFSFLAVIGEADSAPEDSLVLGVVGILGATFCAALMLAFWCVVGLAVVTAQKMLRREGYEFCKTAALVECFLVPPFGLATLVLLRRPEVRLSFKDQQPDQDDLVPASIPE